MPRGRAVVNPAGSHFTGRHCRATVQPCVAGFTIFVASLVLASACARSREYELRGQVLAVDAARQEITIKHEDIKGFMPGMTMPFKVRDAKLLEGSAPGDLVTATLVVGMPMRTCRPFASPGRPR